MSQLKRKAEEDIDQDNPEKKAVTSFKRPLFLQIAWDDGVEMIQIHLKYVDVKTPGCMEIPQDWVFAGEIFPLLYEVIGGIISSRGVCGIIAQYYSSHEGRKQTVGIHSCYKRKPIDSDDEDYSEDDDGDPIKTDDIFDEKAVCAVAGPFYAGYRYYMSLEALAKKACDEVEEYRDQYYNGQSHDIRYHCPHITFWCDFVVPCLPYL